MKGPAKNRLHDYESGWLTLLLMAAILGPQPGETVYDPACGTGGMLLAAVEHVRQAGGDPRTFFGRLYGQEKNVTTSAVARMKLLLHGLEDFEIQRGDTLAEPKFLKGDRLRTFDLVLANPPYSIKQWNRDLWAADPFGRNTLGTPPQGRADYAFFQHILASLDPKMRGQNGRPTAPLSGNRLTT